jgi:hypothetical protein
MSNKYLIETKLKELNFIENFYVDIIKNTTNKNLNSHKKIS